MPRFSTLLATPVAIVLTSFTAASAEPVSARGPGWLMPPQENPGFVVFDLPPAEIERRLGIPYEEMVERRGAVPVAAPSDTGVALVLLCQWNDHPADTVAHPPGAYDTLLFTQGLVDPGSMREYFLEVSYGDYWIQGGVWGWFTRPTYIQNLWFTDFFEAADPLIDYSDYDRDGDGYTDAVWIFHAGPGQEETHDLDDIWSFAVSGLDYMTDDGVIIDRFACNPEMHAGGSIISIRVACHEASHVLGLPDLYDYDAKLDTVTYFTPGDANDHPLVDWCLMGYYGYNIMSFGTRQDPAHLCAWSKARLGFVTPTLLTQPTHDILIPEVETLPVVYRINGPGQEHFLLENRNSASSARFDHLDSDFSAYCPWFTPGQNQKDPGLLILHVDDARSNNNGVPNYRVIVEDAGYDPGRPWDGVSEYSDWWYPYEFRIGAPFAAEDSGQTSFSPVSTPSSAWYGGPSGIWITNISGSDSVMTFDLGFGNAWPAIVRHVPSALDTTMTPGAPFLFEVVAVDEDGNLTTYDWYENGTLAQSGSDSTYLHVAPAMGSADTLLAVATDGTLADSVSWIVRGAILTAVSPSPAVSAAPTLAVAPTPFNPTVAIRLELPRPGPVRLSVHDTSGREVAILLQGWSPHGPREVTWDGTSRSGGQAPSGIYLFRLESGGVVATARAVLLR
jgi:M6 family metalloprotease-like protein